MRENQRRSRARRRDRQQDLEQRLRIIDEARLRATVEMQGLARAVARENARLKALLDAMGAARTRRGDCGSAALGCLRPCAAVRPVEEVLVGVDGYLEKMTHCGGVQGGMRRAIGMQSELREDGI